METKEIEKAAELIKKPGHVVVFSGAGISVESGLTTFRGKGGLYEKYNPSIFDISNFRKNPESSWRVMKERFKKLEECEPNDAHKVLADLEEKGFINSIITQNIDGLHQKAGSKKVIEFHGTMRTCSCMDCKTKHSLNKEIFEKTLPRCEKCEGVLKPDIVFFGEGINPEVVEQSGKEQFKSKVMIVIGTSGEVAPANMIVFGAKAGGAKIIEINPEPSAFTNTITDVFLQGSAREILNEIHKIILI